MIKFLPRCLVAACLTWSAILAIAASGYCDVTELRQLKANDPTTFAGFGRSVSIDGNRAIVGSHRNDGGGNPYGSAYLFDVTTGTQLYKLTASDAVIGQRFGVSAGISGNRAIVGAGLGTGKEELSGAAYLYDVTTGAQLKKLIADDGAKDDLFGEAVAIDGNIALVGAERDGGPGILSGSAYLFDATSGQQLHKLTGSDTALQDEFGVSVAINGNRALVGAWNDDAGRGSAYLFDSTTGQEIRKLTANDGSAGDHFGISVSIRDNLAIIGAYDDDNGAGSAYVFDVSTGQQLHKVTPQNRAASHEFGGSVAIDGKLAVVGDYLEDHVGLLSGSAYVFDTTTGQQLALLIGSDTAINDNFGISVAIDGNTVLVGSRQHSFEPFPGAGFYAGAAYVYAVPEPSSCLLALLGCVAFLSRRSRRHAVHTLFGNASASALC